LDATQGKALNDSKQANITTTGANLLHAPTSSGGNPTGKPVADFLQAPAAQTANTQLMYAPATKGNAPTIVNKNEFLASPAAQTAGSQLLLAPATKGNAPTLFPTSGATGFWVGNEQDYSLGAGSIPTGALIFIHE
jgi:hypothetical protein